MVTISSKKKRTSSQHVESEETIGELRVQVKQLSRQVSVSMKILTKLETIIHKNIINKNITDSKLIRKYYDQMQSSGSRLLHQEQTQYEIDKVRRSVHIIGVRERNKELAKIDIEYLKVELERNSKDIEILKSLAHDAGLE
jgi:hypothetical protein